MSWDLSTIGSMIRSRADVHPSSVAIEDPLEGRQISSGELAELAKGRSELLSSIVSPGERVGIIMESGARLSSWLLAIMWRHAVVPLSPSLTADEVRRYLHLTRTRVLITGLESADLISMCRENDVSVYSPEVVLASSPNCASAEFHTRSDDVAAVLLTSGSTSTPKVVPLTHRNLISGAQQVARSLELTVDDRCLVLWAQHHIGGLVDLLLAPLLSGGAIINGGGFSLEAFSLLFRSAAPSWIQFVPTTLDEVIRDSERRSGPLVPNSLRFIRCVAAPMTTDLWNRAESAFACPLVHTYGMTEASPLITSTPLSSQDRIEGSSGRSQGTEIRILGEDDLPVASGIPGSIVLRGDNVFAGYEGVPSGESTYFSDGFFRTGDIGYLSEDGQLFVLGREKNMINRGGEKINPAEVEDVLRAHPLVKDAAVFGLPHKRLGSLVGAAVSSDSDLEPNGLAVYLSERLAPHKLPSEIRVLRDLPRNEVGKVDTLTLAAQFRDTFGAKTDRYRSEVERIVAEVWSEELELNDPSPIVPFSIAGGDSLSAIRVVSEIERRFGLSGMARTLLGASTIRQMSAIVAPLIGGHEQDSFVTVSPVAQLPRWDNSLGIDEFTNAILESYDPNRCEFEQQLALTHLCGYEIDQLIERVRNSDANLLTASSPLLRWRSRELSLLSRRNSLDDQSWSRHVLHDSVTLYKNSKSTNSGSTLIGFTGSGARLMLPISCILANLPDRIEAVVLVVDLHRRHYQHGIPGLAENPEDIPQALMQLLPESLRRELRTMGASGGGLMAAIAAIDVGAKSFGLVGPDSPERHPRLHRRLDELTRSIEVPLKGRAISGMTKRDLDGLRAVNRLLPGVRSLPYPLSRHGVLHAAWRYGHLRQTLRWLVYEG